MKNQKSNGDYKKTKCEKIEKFLCKKKLNSVTKMQCVCWKVEECKTQAMLQKNL